jgi:hypothetical protein
MHVDKRNLFLPCGLIKLFNFHQALADHTSVFDRFPILTGQPTCFIGIVKVVVLVLNFAIQFFNFFEDMMIFIL